MSRFLAIVAWAYSGRRKASFDLREARRFGAEHEEMVVSADDYLRYFDDPYARVIAACEEDHEFGYLIMRKVLEIVAERLRATRRHVKVALLDQAVLAGVGNIHAAEACWRARLDPRRPGRTPERLHRLGRRLLRDRYLHPRHRDERRTGCTP